MRRHRGGAPPPDSSSSSDEEDAFSALSRKKKKRGRKSLGDKSAKKKINSTPPPKEDEPNDSEGVSAVPSKDGDGGEGTTATSSKTIASETSSTKRHHHKNAARQARMDALLKELQAEKTPGQAAGGSIPGHYGPGGAQNGGRPPPDKKGSFVEAGEEHLTTNIFVGNLAPSITEEELTDAFRQFGDLYSVKIMWPRTPEERARNRNTGFVCFMTRADAQEAMDAFQDADPLDVGRRLVLRWGKNVKKTVKRGTGGVPIPPIRQKDKVSKDAPQTDQRTGESLEESGREDGSSKRRKTEDGTVSNGISLGFGSTDTSAALPPNERLDNVANADTTANESSSATDRSNTDGGTQKPNPGARRSSGVVEDSFPKYDTNIHSADAIRVVSPTDPRRLKFITTVASFIARDGSLLERRLIEKESSNPDFSFLSVGNEISFDSSINNDEEETKRNEWIFYRWRVYSFAQGDGFDSWRTEPFVMFQPHGRYWIPPSLNQEAARQEEEAAKRKEDNIRSMQEERRRLAEKKDFMTGRQLEHAKFGVTTGGSSDGSTKLTDWELEKFNELLREKLCASRESICEAMAFCFDKSGAAKMISSLLKEALLEDGRGVSIDTRIARLYLLSDVLFNSQQPGVRNAFRYRDAVEAMSPEVFDSFGKYGKVKGRMTMNKLRKAVSGVLSAWTNWSVYNATFMDELHARFEGKELKTAITKPEEPPEENAVDESANTADENIPVEDQAQITEAPRGDWTDAEVIPASNDVDGEPLGDEVETKVDGEELGDDDIKELPNEKCIDGEPIVDKDLNVDGEVLVDEEVDGEVLADDDVDGEELADEDLDGEALDDDDIDGEPL